MQRIRPNPLVFLRATAYVMSAVGVASRYGQWHVRHKSKDTLSDATQ